MDENEATKSTAETFIDWNKTAYLPEPHLITEEAFKSRQPSYEKYFQQFWKKPEIVEYSNTMNSEVTKAVTTGLANDTKYHLINLPNRFSCISKSDAHFYIAYLTQPQQAANKEKNEKFKEIQQRIILEQQEYQAFLRLSAQHHFNEYLYLNSGIKEKVQEEILNDVLTVTAQKDKYSLIQTIKIGQDHQKTPFNFIGNVCSQKRVDLLKPSSHLENLSKRMNVSQTKLSRNEKEMMELSVSEKSSFFIKDTSLIAIVESFVNKCEWLIPVTVKECAENKLNKIVFIKKPFPKRSFTTREVYAKFYEGPLKDFYSDSQHIDESNLPSVNAFLCGGFKILIETEVDNLDPVTKRTYSLLPKPEMQCSIGFELFSVVELCKAWWKSRISNTDYIICSRIDVRKDRLGRTDIYSRDMLCSHGSPYNPNVYFTCLLQVLDNLSKCQPGEYFLEHSSENSNILLFQKHDSGTITLDMKYSDLVSKKDLVKELDFSWLPIDCNIGNQLIQNREIPCLFPQKVNNVPIKHKKSRKSKALKWKKHFTPIPTDEVDFFSEEAPRALASKKRPNINRLATSTQEDLIEF